MKDNRLWILLGWTVLITAASLMLYDLVALSKIQKWSDRIGSPIQSQFSISNPVWQKESPNRNNSSPQTPEKENIKCFPESFYLT